MADTVYLHNPDRTAGSVTLDDPAAQGGGGGGGVTLVIQDSTHAHAADSPRIFPIPESGLRGWYQADRITGLVNNDPVSSWPDWSGNANDADQAIASKQPLYKTSIVNGLPALDFVDQVLVPSGLDDELNGAGGASIFAVWKSRDFVSPVAAEVFYMSTGTSATNSRLTLEQRQQSNGNTHNLVNRRADADGATHVTGAALATGDPFKISSGIVDLPGNTATLYKNTKQEAQGNPSSGSTYSATNALFTSIGAFSDATPPTRTLDGQIAEIIFYNRALSTAERERVEAYLSAKYAIASLTIEDATHAHTADNVTFSIALAVQDAAHGHTADQLSLVQHYVLAIQDAAHGHTAENVALTQHNILAIQDALHAHAAENLALIQHHVLAIQEALHGHSADNVVLSLGGAIDLVIQDATHGHTADALTLGVGLVIQDALHGHTADEIALVQHNILAIEDAVHALTSDVVVLSIPGEEPDEQHTVRLRRRRIWTK